AAHQRQLQRRGGPARIRDGAPAGSVRAARRRPAAGRRGMSAEILINVTPMETRVALIEQGLLQEIYIERHKRAGPVGNIYMGKVVRVMPGMQAAIVDIGLDRAGFVHAADIAAVDAEGFEVESRELPIGQLVREGQMLVVQVLKEPIAPK